MILAYVGVKMLLVGPPVEWHPPTYLSLTVVAVVLTVAIVASLRADARDPQGPVADELVDRAIEEGDIPEPPLH